MAPKYVTDGCTDPSTRLQNTNLKDCWLQSSSVYPQDEDQEDAGHKTVWCKYTETSSRERDELGQELRLWSQFA